MKETLDVSRIIPGDNDRTEFDPLALQDLAGSIEQDGLQQPIVVRPIWLCDRCGHRVARGDFGPCPSCGGELWRDPYEIVAGD